MDHHGGSPPYETHRSSIAHQGKPPHPPTNTAIRNWACGVGFGVVLAAGVGMLHTKKESQQ
jgi:hypothetical protein